jgi:uroporphyrinogen decarboxylase
VDWHKQLCETLDIDTPGRPEPAMLNVDFRMIPQFEEKVLEHRDGHYIVQDWKGNICEISDTYDVSYLRTAKDFVTRRWIKCPVETRDDWEQMKLRYDPRSPERFPDEFEQRAKQLAERDDVLVIGVAGPFWQMREWCGFEGLCMMMIDQPGLVAEMAAFWEDFVATLLDRILPHVVPDMFWISEDMAYKVKAMISPAMTREYCQSSWVRWARQVRTAGCPLVDMDSDGFVGELIPLWIESGVNVCDPMEVAAGNDLVALRHEFGHRMAYRGGVDKRAMACGGQKMRDELKRLEPVIRDGGYIPGCDHGVPSDVSWPDYVAYCQLLARMTGWR